MNVPFLPFLFWFSELIACVAFKRPSNCFMPDRSCLRLPLAPTAIGAGDCLVLMRDQARARNQVQRLSQSQSYNTHPCPCITSGHTFSMHTFSMHTFSMHSIKSICLVAVCLPLYLIHLLSNITKQRDCRCFGSNDGSLSSKVVLKYDHCLLCCH